MQRSAFDTPKPPVVTRACCSKVFSSHVYCLSLPVGAPRGGQFWRLPVLYPRHLPCPPQAAHLVVQNLSKCLFFREIKNMEKDWSWSLIHFLDPSTGSVRLDEWAMRRFRKPWRGFTGASRMIRLVLSRCYESVGRMGWSVPSVKVGNSGHAPGAFAINAKSASLRYLRRRKPFCMAPTLTSETGSVRLSG